MDIRNLLWQRAVKLDDVSKWGTGTKVKFVHILNVQDKQVQRMHKAIVTNITDEEIEVSYRRDGVRMQMIFMWDFLGDLAYDRDKYNTIAIVGKFGI